MDEMLSYNIMMLLCAPHLEISQLNQAEIAKYLFRLKIKKRM